jgi:hypothetical protein
VASLVPGARARPAAETPPFEPATSRNARNHFGSGSRDPRVGVPEVTESRSPRRVHRRFLGLPATGPRLRLPRLGHAQPPGRRRRMSASSHDPPSPCLATQDGRFPSPPSAAPAILAPGLAMPHRPFP